MKTFIYWNVKAKKSEAEIIEMMKKEARFFSESRFFRVLYKLFFFQPYSNI